MYLPYPETILAIFEPSSQSPNHTASSVSSSSINSFLKPREQTLFFFIQAYGYTLQIEVP